MAPVDVMKLRLPLRERDGLYGLENAVAAREKKIKPQGVTVALITAEL